MAKTLLSFGKDGIYYNLSGEVNDEGRFIIKKSNETLYDGTIEVNDTGGYQTTAAFVPVVKTYKIREKSKEVETSFVPGTPEEGPKDYSLAEVLQDYYTKKFRLQRFQANCNDKTILSTSKTGKAGDITYHIIKEEGILLTINVNGSANPFTVSVAYSSDELPGKPQQLTPFKSTIPDVTTSKSEAALFTVYPNIIEALETAKTTSTTVSHKASSVKQPQKAIPLAPPKVDTINRSCNPKIKMFAEGITDNTVFFSLLSTTKKDSKNFPDTTQKIAGSSADDDHVKVTYKTKSSNICNRTYTLLSQFGFTEQDKIKGIRTHIALENAEHIDPNEAAEFINMMIEKEKAGKSLYIHATDDVKDTMQMLLETKELAKQMKPKSIYRLPDGLKDESTTQNILTKLYPNCIIEPKQASLSKKI